MWFVVFLTEETGQKEREEREGNGRQKGKDKAH